MEYSGLSFMGATNGADSTAKLRDSIIELVRGSDKALSRAKDDEIIAVALRRGLAAMRVDFERENVDDVRVVAAPGRERLEGLALRAIWEARDVAKKERSRELKELSRRLEHSCLYFLSDVKSLIDAVRSGIEAPTLPERGQILEGWNEGSTATEADLQMVLKAFPVTKRTLIVRYHVTALVPFLDKVDCTGFDSCERVILRPRSHFTPPEEVPVLSEIELWMGLPDPPRYDKDDERMPSYPQRDQKAPERMPELERAHELLEHVLSCLRMGGLGVSYDRNEGELGRPYDLRVQFEFADGSTRTAEGITQYVTVGRADSRQTNLAPVRVPPELFERAWNEARVEPAIRTNSEILVLVDRYRRAFMILESHFRPIHDGAKTDAKEEMKSNGLTALVSKVVEACPELLKRWNEWREVMCVSGKKFDAITDDLVDLRNDASHHQRRKKSEDGQLELLHPDRARGLPLYEPKFRKRLIAVVEITEAAALNVLRDRAPQMMAPKLVRPVTEMDTKELLEFHSLVLGHAGHAHSARNIRMEIYSRMRNGTACSIEDAISEIDTRAVDRSEMQTLTRFAFEMPQLREPVARLFEGRRDLDTIVQWAKNHAHEAPDFAECLRAHADKASASQPEN